MINFDKCHESAVEQSHERASAAGKMREDSGPLEALRLHRALTTAVVLVTLSGGVLSAAEYGTGQGPDHPGENIQSPVE